MKCLTMLLIFVSQLSFAALDPVESNEIVQAQLATHKSLSMTNYCVVKTTTCRTLERFADAEGKISHNFFRISFFSGERQVGASEYFVRIDRTDKFHRFVDEKFDGKVVITKESELQTVHVNSKVITIKDLYMPRLGTTQYVTSDLIFNQELARVNGIALDRENPDYREVLKIDYLIIK